MQQRRLRKGAGFKPKVRKIPQLYVNNESGQKVISPEFREMVLTVCKIIGVPVKDSMDSSEAEKAKLNQLLERVSKYFIFSLVPLQGVTASYNTFFNKNEELLIALGKKQGSDPAYFARKLPIELIVRYETDVWLIDGLHKAGLIEDFSAAKAKYDGDFIEKNRDMMDFEIVDARPSQTSFFTKPNVQPSVFDDTRLNAFRASIGLDGVGISSIKEIIAQSEVLKEKTKFEDYWEQIKIGLNLKADAQPENVFSQYYATIKSAFEKDMDLIHAMKNAGTIEEDKYEKSKEMYIKNNIERMILLKDAIIQIKNIEKEGYKENTIVWKDETARYKQKHAVVTASINYLLDKIDIEEFKKVQVKNPKYVKTAKPTEALTVTLIERIKKYKEELTDKLQVKPSRLKGFLRKS